MNEHVRNPQALEWIERTIELVKPAKVVLIDGSEEQKAQLTREAVESGELHELNQEKLPGCYLMKNTSGQENKNSRKRQL